MVDIDLLQFFVQVWEMYHTNPIFWIIAIPFALWWVNFLKSQFYNLGLTRLASSIFYLAGKLTHRAEKKSFVTPSPRSGAPFKLWKELMIFPLFMSPLVIFIAFTADYSVFSVQWWFVVFMSIAIVLFFSIPVYLPTLAEWLKIKNKVKEAIQKLTLLNIGDKETGHSFLDLFVKVADEFRMGLDPRLLPIIVQVNQLDNLLFLNELVSLSLIRPDRKTEPDVLANRYYLTRIGATLVEKLKKKEKEKGQK